MNRWSGAPDDYDVGIACLLDRQDGVTFLACGAGNVAQRLLAAQAHAEDFTRLHAFKLELGAHERHGANFVGDVDGLVGGDCHGPTTIPRPPAGVGYRCMPDRKSKLEALCAERGLKMTDQRRVIARVLSEAHDHPDVEAVHRRATAIDPNISIATVYRTVRLFEEAGILAKHDFGDGRARYEETPDEHHDHLIDIQSGKVVEFHNDEIEELQRKIAEKAGYKLVGHRLELYGVPLDGKNARQK
jgi:Fur family ferric uptake transcriptional regulator